MKKVKVTSVKEITEEVFIASLDYQPFFIPGQVVNITEDLSLPPRMYSICSPPDNPSTEILFDLKQDGRLTPYLSKTRAGDFIYVSRPSGNFMCPESEKAFWIASGTGIAPFASMFYAGNTDNKLLIHGGRKLESFYFQHDIAPVMKENYVRCCTTETATDIYPGRLTRWLKEQQELPKDYKYYLCGSAEMVVQTRDILVSKGIAFDSVIAEIYF